MLEVRCRYEGGAVVFEIDGEVCLSSAPVLASCLESAFEADSSEVIVDLRDCTLFTSQGATILTRATKRCAEDDRTLTVRNARGVTRQVVDLLGIHGTASRWARSSDVLEAAGPG